MSGDFNPIHMHPLSARLFGFPSAIAHGMWTKARSLAALGPQLPGAFTVEVAFRRPLLLPATVTFGEAREPGRIRFGVRDIERGRSHLDGLLTRLTQSRGKSSNICAQAVQHGSRAAQLLVVKLGQRLAPQALKPDPAGGDQLAPGLGQRHQDDALVVLGAGAGDQPVGLEVVEHLGDRGGGQVGHLGQPAG